VQERLDAVGTRPQTSTDETEQTRARFTVEKQDQPAPIARPMLIAEERQRSGVRRIECRRARRTAEANLGSSAHRAPVDLVSRRLHRVGGDGTVPSPFLSGGTVSDALGPCDIRREYFLATRALRGVSQDSKLWSKLSQDKLLRTGKMVPVGGQHHPKSGFRHSRDVPSSSGVEPGSPTRLAYESRQPELRPGDHSSNRIGRPVRGCRSQVAKLSFQRTRPRDEPFN